MRRRFVYTDAKSNKFWEIEYAEGEVSFTAYWGRVGTKGQSKTQTLDTAEAASKEVDKLIKAKVRKDYVEDAGAAGVVDAAGAVEAEPATAAASSEKPAANAKKPSAKKPAVEPFGELDGKAVGKIASSLNRRKRGHMEGLEKAAPGLDSPTQARLIAHLLRQDLIELPSIALVRLLTRQLDALDDEDLVAVLRHFPEQTLTLEDYGYGGPGKTEIVDGMHAEFTSFFGKAAARVGDALESVELGPNVRRGLAFGARMMGEQIDEEIADEIFCGVLQRLTTSKLDERLKLAFCDEDGVERTLSREQPADVVALLKRLGPASGWRPRYLEVHRQRGCGTLAEAVVVEAFGDAPLSEVEEVLDLYDLHAPALIAVRDDAPEVLFEMARRAKIDRLATVLAVWGAARQAAPLPGELDARIELISINHRIANEGRAMLQRIGHDRANAIGRRALAKSSGESTVLGLLGTHFGPEFLGELFDAIEERLEGDMAWRGIGSRVKITEPSMLEVILLRLKGAPGEHERRGYHTMYMQALNQVLGEAPEGMDDHVDPSKVLYTDEERAFQRLTAALPLHRAEPLLTRYVEVQDSHKLRVMRLLREGLSTGFQRRVAAALVAMQDSPELGIELNPARLKELGDGFGDILADAIGEGRVSESFLAKFRHKLTPKAFEILEARMENTESVLDEMRRLASELPGPHRRIYLMRRGTEPAAQDSVARIGGLPRGIAADAVPRYGKRKLVHVVTFDLTQMPELAARYPDKRSLSVFEQYYTEQLTRGQALVALDDDEVRAAPGSTTGSCELELEALDVPEAIFSDPDLSDNPDGVYRLQRLVYQAQGYALGGPIWMHQDATGVDETFILQLSDSLTHSSINLGDLGDLYVFEDRGEWSSH